jgi:hypothetical protein
MAMLLATFPATSALQRAPTPQMKMYEKTRRAAGWLPGSDAPTYLDGSLVGDVGFDPYCMVALARTGTATGLKKWKNVERETQMVIASDYERKRRVLWMREAEIKHSRLAMMAAAGWPLSELLDGPLSKLFGMPNVMEKTAGRAPSILNGHLFDGPQAAAAASKTGPPLTATLLCRGGTVRARLLQAYACRPLGCSAPPGVSHGC